jgi:NADPH-dependent curcumin reductase CurA
MQGFLIFDHKDYYPTARRDLREWIRSGAIRYKEDILEGIEAAPDSIAGLYRGENIGKRLIKVLKD